jgi:hypothetical protein
MHSGRLQGDICRDFSVKDLCGICCDFPGLRQVHNVSTNRALSQISV